MYFDRHNCRRIRDLVEICGFLEVAIEQLEKLERETLLEIEQEKTQKALVNGVNIKQEPPSGANKNVTNSSASILPHLNDIPTTSCTNTRPGPRVVLNSGITLAQNLPSSASSSTSTTPINNVEQRKENESYLSAGQCTKKLSNSLETVFHSKAVHEVLDSLNSTNGMPTEKFKLKGEVKKEPVSVDNLLLQNSNTGTIINQTIGFNPQLRDSRNITETNNVENLDSYNTLNDNSSQSSASYPCINGQNTAGLQYPNTSSSDNQQGFKVFIKFRADFSPGEIKHILLKNGFKHVQNIFASNTKTVITLSEQSEVKKLMKMRTKKGLKKLLAHYIAGDKKTKKPK